MNAEQVLSKPAAMRLLAETLEQADGLPPIDLIVTTNPAGEPIVIVETLDAYEWANHLRLYPLPNTVTGEVQFRGVINGVQWAVMYLPQRPVPYTLVDWNSPTQVTQMVPVVNR